MPSTIDTILDLPTVDLAEIREEFEVSLERFALGMERSTDAIQQSSFMIRSNGYENKLPHIFTKKVRTLAAALGKKELSTPQEIILSFFRNIIVASTYIPLLEESSIHYLRQSVEALGKHSHVAKEALMYLLVDVIMGMQNVPGKLPSIPALSNSQSLSGSKSATKSVSRMAPKEVWSVVGAVSMVPFQSERDMKALVNGLRRFLQVYREDMLLTKSKLKQLVALLRVSVEAENLVGVQPADYYTPMLFSQAFSDVLFPSHKKALVDIVKEDPSMIQDYVALLVVSSDGLTHLLSLCRDIAVATIRENDLPVLLLDPDLLSPPYLAFLKIFYTQIAFSQSKLGKDIMGSLLYIAAKQVSKGPLYQFLEPLTQLRSLLAFFLQRTPEDLVNAIELSLHIIYRRLQRVLQDEQFNQAAPGYQSIKALFGQVLGLLLQAIIHLKASLSLTHKNAKILTNGCFTRIDGLLQLFFGTNALYSTSDTGNTIPLTFADTISFVLASELDLFEALKSLCKNNMLVVDALGCCVQNLRMCYRTMIEDSTADEGVSMVSPNLLMVREDHQQQLTRRFPMVSYTKLVRIDTVHIDKRHLNRVQEVFRGKALTVDTGSRVSFTYTHGQLSITLNSYALVMLLIVFMQSLSPAEPPRVKQLVSAFFTAYEMENTTEFRITTMKLILALTFDFPLLCLSKTGYPAVDDQIEYLNGLITSFEDIAGYLECTSIQDFGAKSRSMEQLGALFVYSNPFVSDVVTLLVEQEVETGHSTDLYDPKTGIFDLYFLDYISPLQKHVSAGTGTGVNACVSNLHTSNLSPTNMSASASSQHQSERRKYNTHNHIAVKACIVQKIKSASCTLSTLYSMVEQHWEIELSTVKGIMNELVDTGVLDVDEKGAYVYDI